MGTLEWIFNAKNKVSMRRKHWVSWIYLHKTISFRILANFTKPDVCQPHCPGPAPRDSSPQHKRAIAEKRPPTSARPQRRQGLWVEKNIVHVGCFQSLWPPFGQPILGSRSRHVRCAGWRQQPVKPPKPCSGVPPARLYLARPCNWCPQGRRHAGSPTPSV